MRHMTLGDLGLGLHDLFDKRHNDLMWSQSGRLYAPMLAQKRDAIDALPSAMGPGLPLATELSDTDDRHDGFGMALWGYTEAVIRAPDTAPEVRASAQRIRDAFIPNKSALQDSYADEAAAAKRLRPALVEFAKDLRSFPVPGDKTLYDWASAFINAGDQLDKLLSDRAVIMADQSGGENAAQLRGSTVGILTRFRSALLDELLVNVALPRNLEARVFGYFDELQARRRAGKSRHDNGEESPK